MIGSAVYSGTAWKRSMGWRGGGLGVAGREGRAEPVEAGGVRGMAGLGYEAPTAKGQQNRQRGERGGKKQSRDRQREQRR